MDTARGQEFVVKHRFAWEASYPFVNETGGGVAVCKYCSYAVDGEEFGTLNHVLTQDGVDEWEIVYDHK